MTTPTIVWITDVPGWAYDNRARNLAAQLPGYTHRFACYSRLGWPNTAQIAAGATIIVCPDPRTLSNLDRRSNVVLNLNAVKIFRGPATP